MFTRGYSPRLHLAPTVAWAPEFPCNSRTNKTSSKTFSEPIQATSKRYNKVLCLFWGQSPSLILFISEKSLAMWVSSKTLQNRMGITVSNASAFQVGEVLSPIDGQKSYDCLIIAPIFRVSRKLLINFSTCSIQSF